MRDRESTAFPRFRTQAGRQRFEQAYAAALEQWPVPYASLEVPTSAGPTHVVASGPEHARPLVLLPSFSGTALAWRPNIRALSRDHRVYAVDTIGQPGLSVCHARMRTREDYVRWLSEVLDGLDAGKTAIAGSSFGAYAGAIYAAAHPDRVERLVLIGPAGVFARMSTRVMLRLLTSGVRRSLARLLGLGGSPDASSLFSPEVVLRDEDGPWRRLMEVTMSESPKVTLVSPEVLQADELRALGARSMVLVGEHEQLFDPAVVLARAREFGFTTVLVEGADHLAAMTQPERVNALVLEFLGSGS